jgi:hypothetical protein
MRRHKGVRRLSSLAPYCTKVVAYGILCIITTLEFFQHHFFETGHKNTSCDPYLHPRHQATNAPLPHAKRPPPGGYVQTRKPEKSGPVLVRLPDITGQSLPVFMAPVMMDFLWSDLHMTHQSRS